MFIAYRPFDPGPLRNMDRLRRLWLLTWSSLGHVERWMTSRLRMTLRALCFSLSSSELIRGSIEDLTGWSEPASLRARQREKCLWRGSGCVYLKPSKVPLPGWSIEIILSAKALKDAWRATSSNLEILEVLCFFGCCCCSGSSGSCCFWRCPCVCIAAGEDLEDSCQCGSRVKKT